MTESLGWKQNWWTSLYPVNTGLQHWQALNEAGNVFLQLLSEFNILHLPLWAEKLVAEADRSLTGLKSLVYTSAFKNCWRSSILFRVALIPMI